MRYTGDEVRLRNPYVRYGHKDFSVVLPDGWQLFVQTGVVADFIEFEEEQAGPAAQQVAPLERAEPLVAAAKQREQPHVAQTRGGAGNGCAFGEERCMGVEVLQGLLRFSQKDVVALDAGVDEWIVDVADGNACLLELHAQKGVFVAVL